MVQRPTPGSPLSISANALGDAYEAGEWYQQRKRLGQGLPPTAALVNPAVIKIRNDTGGDLTAGAVVEIGASTLTTLDRQNLWFSADVRSGDDPFCAVLLEPIPYGKYGNAQVAGVCIASVNVIDTDNTHARAVPGETTLKGDFGGWCRILYKPSGTGVLQCVVLICGTESVTRKIKTTSSIPAAGSGTADFYISGSDKDELTVYHNWADDADIPADTETYARYFHDEDKWVITPPVGGTSSSSTPLYLIGSTRYKTGSSTWTRGGTYASSEYWTLGYGRLFGSETDNNADIKTVSAAGDHFWEVDQSGWYRISIYDTFQGAYTGTTTATATTSTTSGHNHTATVYDGTGRMWQVGGTFYYKTSVGGAYTAISDSSVIGYALNEVGASYAPNTPRGSIACVLFLNLTSGWLIQRRFGCSANSLNEHEIAWEDGRMQIEYMGATQTEFSPT